MIPTPQGYKQLKELSVGDYVFDRLGKPTQILGIYPQGEKEVYRVTFKDSRTSECAPSHLWTYYSPSGVQKTITTEEMLKAGLKDASDNYKYKIPQNRAVQYSEYHYDIDPYMMGVFLGAGCYKEYYLTLSSEDEEIPNMIGKLIDATPIKNPDKNYQWTFQWNKTVKQVEENGSGQKREKVKPKTIDYFGKYLNYIRTEAYNRDIPPKYKIGSINQRFSLLQGLMDTHSNIDNSSGKYNMRLPSTSIKMLLSVKEILHSLGYSSTIHKDHRTYYININVPNEEKYKFFRLSRKKVIAEQARFKHKRHDYSKIAITQIEDLGYTKPMICLYVNNSEHLYLTQNYIVTHNTTLISTAIEELNLTPNQVAYVAYTGKAAQVLAEKGCPNATTAHQLLYKTYINEKTGKFYHKPKAYLGNYKLIVVDEVSMLPKEMWDLLLSHGIYVIAIGDPFQLPAVSGEDNGVLRQPHVFLSQVMRQAQDSEIIRLTMQIREGKSLSLFKGKDVRVVTKKELQAPGIWSWPDQILVAKNDTRKKINTLIRKGIYHRDTEIPQEGDKIICLKNNWTMVNSADEALVNGMTGFISNIKPYFPKNPYCNTFAADFQPDYKNATMFPALEMDEDIFTGKIKKNDKVIPRHFIPEQFDYGYAITTWKAQGSEWDKVLVIEENFPFKKEEHARFLYTAATRASQKLILVKQGF